MRILVYSDLQADIGGERLFNDPTCSLRLWCVEKFYRDLQRIYTEHKCHALYDLGDTFDDRTAIDIPTINTVIKGLEWLPPGNNHVRLIGNHDQYQKNGSIHNGRLLSQYFNTIDKRRIQMMDNWAAFFVSYPADHLETAEWLLKEASRIDCPKLLFGHFQVEGAFLNNSTTLTGIPKSTLQKFDLVMLGHIHIPQAVTPKIHYIGSPFQQDWGETNQQKRVGIVDTSTLTVQWVPLEGYPEYRSVTLEDFNRVENEANEHRYRVILNSHEETEAFFRHPHFNRATAQYSYDETKTDQAVTNHDWTFEGTCRRYLELVPPSKNGIEITHDEMLEVIPHIIKP